MENRNIFVKCNDSLFVDFRIIKTIIVEETAIVDTETMKVRNAFQVLGFNRDGIQIVKPLFKHEEYAECEAWINAHFLS